MDQEASQSRKAMKEQAKKNETMLGKRIRSSSLDSKENIYLSSCRLIEKDQKCFTMYHDKLTLMGEVNTSSVYPEVKNSLFDYLG